MLSKSAAKLIRSLKQKKFRDQERLFVVEGVKMVREALASNYAVRAVYTQDVALFPDATPVNEREMAGITQLYAPSPALAVLEQAVNESPDKSLEKGALYIGLDAVRDPGNAGTIIRIADWFGIKAVFASADTVELYNPKVVQASMGAIFRIPVIYTDLTVLADQADVPVWGTLLEGESIYRTDLSSNGVILIGNEAHGLSPALRQKIDHALYIPPYPPEASGSESLNAAAAAAVVCAAFRRRLP